MIGKLEKTKSTQNRKRPITEPPQRMGATLNNKSTTTEPLPFNRPRPNILGNLDVLTGINYSPKILLLLKTEIA